MVFEDGDRATPSHLPLEATPTGERGRQPDYSDAAIQTCLTMKVFDRALCRIWVPSPNLRRHTYGYAVARDVRQNHGIRTDNRMIADRDRT